MKNVFRSKLPIFLAKTIYKYANGRKCEILVPVGVFPPSSGSNRHFAVRISGLGKRHPQGRSALVGSRSKDLLNTWALKEQVGAGAPLYKDYVFVSSPSGRAMPGWWKQCRPLARSGQRAVAVVTPHDLQARPFFLPDQFASARR
jgi:hypothetical protein